MPLASAHFELPDETATEALGQQLAWIVLNTTNQDPPQSTTGGTEQTAGLIYLQGNLGTGKTSLVRAFLRACGVTGRIKSPSYALLETYNVSRLNLYHIDFYRFNDPRELAEAGLRDLFTPDAVVLIEWPEKAAGHLPAPDLMIRLDLLGMGRRAEVEAATKRGASWLSKLTRSNPPSS
jgi:tRNA threonylcarbamoyladenosine biosynthesis protein TsaE